jgi:hypothetical protein
MAETNYTLKNTPKTGHTDVGPFFWRLYEQAKQEKERLSIPEKLAASYASYRGAYGDVRNRYASKRRKAFSVNLFFANIQRTVANITSKNPVAEVSDQDGINDGADKFFTQAIKNWWSETEQGEKLRTSALKMEKYGITVERYNWDKQHFCTNTVIVDPYAWFPAPGYYDSIDDYPYMCMAEPDAVEDVEAKFGVTDVEPDDVYSLLGEDREDYRPIPTQTTTGAAAYEGGKSMVANPTEISRGGDRMNRALVVQVWARDLSKDGGGNLIYPDGIRCVTMTNQGRMVLADGRNPNVNWELMSEQYRATYAWGRLPFGKANSYKDTTSVWGFSAIEQTGDIILKINEIINRLVAWALKTMSPTLIVPQDSGVKRAQINNKPNLVLFPTTANAASGIRYLDVPNLPSGFFTVLDILRNFHDQVHQIEDADRGVVPSGVTAASAIMALQERNAVLMQHKIFSIDYLVRTRGRWAISMEQNFGAVTKRVEVEGEQVAVRPIELAGRNFNYLVESGGTVAKTSLQIQEQSIKLWESKGIDRQALLETLNYPGWKEVIERMGETELDAALQVLVQAGLPEDGAYELKQFLMQPQGGPGNRPQGNAPSSGSGARAGVPRAYQGAAV